MEYKIDATDKILGRLAVEISLLLRGKNRPDFDPSKLSGNVVKVFNSDKIRVTGKKMLQKLYRRHSGFHGGLKSTKLEELMARDSREVIKKAVMGMLPKNRIRAKVIKNLKVYKSENA